MKFDSFETLRKSLQQNEKMRIVIAGADEEEILLAAQAKHLAAFILLGDEKRIVKIMDDNGISRSDFEIINVEHHDEIAKLAIKMIHEKKADIPMKGLIHTSLFMSAVLNKESGLERSRRLSQITVFHDTKCGDGGFKFLTDCAINIDTSLPVKKDIIENAVQLAQVLGCNCPKVALLGAVETVSEAMPDTMDSAVLTQMNRRGQIKGCVIDGPLSLDNAISKEAALRKGITGEVAGVADILVGSCLQEANSLSKSLHFYAHLETASMIVGTKQPIIMTSRTDAKENKLNSIAVTCFYQKQMGL